MGEGEERGSARVKGPKGGLGYRDAGVDIDAGEALVRAIAPLARATERPGSMGAIGGFGGLFDLSAAGFRDPVLVAATDGVGTKLEIAIETGNHASIGIDLVAMCVNDLVVQGAEPLFFLDYYACGKLDVATAEAVVAGIAEGCREAGAALIGGETAEMPGMYGAGAYDLAGFAVGAVERGAILPRRDLAPGDVILALPASGPHSNGYSLIRKIRALSGLSWQDAPAPVAPQRLGEAVLEPTRIYVRPLLAAMRETGAIKALAHITGGGLVENVPRVLPAGLEAVIDLGAWQAPAVFRWIRDAGGVAEHEMLRTFNCGVGMVVIAGRADADRVEAALRAAGEAPFAIGALAEASDGAAAPAVRFEGTLSFARGARPGGAS